MWPRADRLCWVSQKAVLQTTFEGPKDRGHPCVTPMPLVLEIGRYTVVDVTKRASRFAVPQISMSGLSVNLATATLRQIAAGAFTRPPRHVPRGPKLLWKRTM
jgi:hypothetical protein